MNGVSRLGRSLLTAKPAPPAPSFLDISLFRREAVIATEQSYTRIRREQLGRPTLTARPLLILGTAETNVTLVLSPLEKALPFFYKASVSKPTVTTVRR